MKNPITKAYIVGANYDSNNYKLKSRSRGEKDYAMSRSSLKNFAVCPSKWRKYGDGEDDSTSSTEWGSLVDTLLLEPSRFDMRYAIKPEQYPVEDKKTGAIVEWKDWSGNSTWCKNWLAEHDGFNCISAAAIKEAKKAVELAEKEFEAFLADSKFQVCVHGEYRDDATGLIIPLTALIDIVPRLDLLADFKTARSADLSTWPRVVHSQWYDAQAALYLDIFNAATGERREKFHHLIQENEHPYECTESPLSVEFIKIGRDKYLTALRRYARCLATGHWDTYADLHAERNRGLNITEPESWMIENVRVEDPDWLTEPSLERVQEAA